MVTGDHPITVQAILILDSDPEWEMAKSTDEHQKRLHFTKEEWAISVEGRRQRQNVEKVKLDDMPSLEEMFTKKYLNTPEQKVKQSFNEIKDKEVKAAVVDAHDVKEEVDDELPSPCPSPGQSPKRTSDENEFELKEEVEESFF